MNPSKPNSICKALRRTALVTVLAASSAVPLAHADEVEDMSRMVNLMTGFFDLMDAMYDAASNPEHATLIQMNTLEDIYKERGQHAAVIEVYRKVLDDARNPTVRRIAYLRLADALKETGRPDEAISVLERGIAESVQAANAAQ